MSDWTLGAVKARNLALEAHCRAEGCRRFYTFDLDRMIEAQGADFPIDDIPAMACAACGGPLVIRLAMIPPEEEA
jgi:hypothetical protein